MEINTRCQYSLPKSFSANVCGYNGVRRANLGWKGAEGRVKGGKAMGVYWFPATGIIYRNTCQRIHVHPLLTRQPIIKVTKNSPALPPCSIMPSPLFLFCGTNPGAFPWQQKASCFSTIPPQIKYHFYSFLPIFSLFSPHELLGCFLIMATSIRTGQRSVTPVRLA